MKKFLCTLIVTTVLGLAAKAATPLFHTLNTATGSTLTIDQDYKSEQLVSIEAFSANATTGTITITRIRGTRTNQVGAITLSSSAGIYRDTNSVWLKNGDQLVHTHSAGATNAMIEIVTEISTSE